jgi:hypothetical protein
LGAGFSCAVSTAMPAMYKLGNDVRRYLESEDDARQIPGMGTPLTEDFEQWLSYLVESPPWLSRADQALNQWAAIKVTDAVNKVINVCQVKALEPRECPPWLKQLVRHWQQHSSTVITFNYDILVELAWLLFGVDTPTSWLYLYPVPIQPAGSRQGAVLGGERPQEFPRLLKLHGSLNWRYSGVGGPPNDTIWDIGIEGSEWGPEGAGPRYAAADALTIDRFPFVVPPAAVKSPYYGNQTLQGLWRLAAEALKGTDELVIMAFSMPQTDLLVRSLLATNFVITKSSIITVVNRSPDDVVKRVIETFKPDLHDGDDRVITTYRGDNAIPMWVQQHCATS